MSGLPAALEVEEPSKGIRRWEVYSPGHKVVLSSHAVLTPGGWIVFDPIPLGGAGDGHGFGPDGLRAIVLTNGNHERAAAEWVSRWSTPLWIPAGSGLDLRGARVVESGRELGEGWRLHELAGGGPGETAFRYDPLDLVVMGDAVVNLAGRGLEILPDRYCTDPSRLRAGLARLAVEPFERLCLAHGAPVWAGAWRRVAELLEAGG